MVQIAPSILSADFAHLERDCQKVVSDENRMLHFDVMDGVFVPNISFGVPVLKSLKKAMPQAFYDVHLMIVEPDEYVDAFADAGADGITFHTESQSLVRQTILHIRERGLVVGITLKPSTPVDLVTPYLQEVDMVLVMSVEPGFGGQEFWPEAPERIRQLRAEAQKQKTNLLIQVDGGINLQTAPLCVKAGADILVAGSAVFGAQNPGEMVQKLRTAGI